MKHTPTTVDSNVKQAVNEALQRFASNHHGKNASYIPYLAGVPSHLFGISIMFCDGSHAEAGDTGYAFAIESISKVFTLAHVLDEVGPQALRSKSVAIRRANPSTRLSLWNCIKADRSTPL